MPPNPDNIPGGADSPARYANYLEIGYNSVEFVLAFGDYRRDEPGPRFLDPIVTNPFYAKLFLRVLEESVRNYEAEYGPLRED